EEVDELGVGLEAPGAVFGEFDLLVVGFAGEVGGVLEAAFDAAAPEVPDADEPVGAAGVAEVDDEAVFLAWLEAEAAADCLHVEGLGLRGAAHEDAVDARVVPAFGVPHDRDGAAAPGDDVARLRLHAPDALGLPAGL